VTSFLDVLNKPWIAPWYAKTVAENAVELMMDIVDAYEQSDIKPFNENPLFPFLDVNDGLDFEDIAKILAESPTWERDAAGEFGDVIHLACEEILSFSKGNPKIAREYFDTMKLAEPAFSRVSMFVDFLEHKDVKVLFVEPMVYNDTYGYAGSCDFIAIINGKLYFVDLKTSKNLSETFALQVSAYAHCEYILDEDGKEFPMPTGTEGAEGCVIHIEPKRLRMIEVDISDEMFECVLSCLRVKRLWFQDAKKKALGEVIYNSKKAGKKHG